MQTVYVGNTLINDIMLGSQRMDDALQYLKITAEYLIVAGGGGGGNDTGGGGGAGGVLSGSINIKPGTYTVTVGNGGRGQIWGSNSPENGENSSFYGLTAIGGGYGAYKNTSTAIQSSWIGGSGGGASSQATTPGAYGGTAQGKRGGFTSGGHGSGGGGQSQTGQNATLTGRGADGGEGVTSSITGVSTQYAGGGGGGGTTSGGLGKFGGGNGVTSGTPNNGAANTGGGGGGTGGQFPNNSGNGGSGIVVIRYLGPPQATGGTITQDGNYTVHKFTTSGTFTY